MFPVLFDINGFTIHTYGALGALGFLFVAFTALYRTRKLGLKPERTADLIFISALAGLVGSRIVFLIQNPVGFESVYSWINLRTGGLVFYGAVLFAVPVASGLIWRFGFPFFKTWDIFAAAFPIAHGFARLGCYGAGCCYGAPSDGPFAVAFPEGHPTHGTMVHPTQLYEAFFLFGLGIVVNLVYRYKRWDGQVTLVYLVGYAIGRSIIETYRGDASRGYFLPQVLGNLMTYSQGISLVMAVFGIVVFGVIAKRVSSPS